VETYTAVGYKSFVANTARPGTCLQKKKRENKCKLQEASGWQRCAGLAGLGRLGGGCRGPGDVPVAMAMCPRGCGTRSGEGGKVSEHRGERGKAVRALSAEDQLASITDFI